jgi:hypothetical protein
LRVVAADRCREFNAVGKKASAITRGSLLERFTAAAEARHLSQNTFTADRRTWLKLIAWTAAEGLALQALPSDSAGSSRRRRLAAGALLIAYLYCKELRLSRMAACLEQNEAIKPLGATSEGSSLISSKDHRDETCRKTTWPLTSAAGGRFWRGRQLLVWDPRSLSVLTVPEADRFLGAGKNAASLKRIRAAPSFAYKHCDLKNPSARIEPPLQKEPKDPISPGHPGLVDYLKALQRGYGSALAFQLASASSTGYLISVR